MPIYRYSCHAVQHAAAQYTVQVNLLELHS